MTLLNFLVVTTRFLGIICLLSFVWAAIFHFKHPAYFDYRKSLLSVSASLITALDSLLLFRAAPMSEFRSIAAIALFILSLTIFISAIRVSSKKLDFAFSISSPSELISSGPYNYLRHPFYTAYSLSWFGCFVFSGNIISLLCTAWMFFLYFSAARFEEKAFLEGPLKNRYSLYRLSKGMFFPKVTSATSQSETDKFEKGA